MQFPPDLWSITILLGITATILLITTTFVSLNDEQNGVLVDEKRLRRAAFAFGVLFLFMVIIRILRIMIES